MSFEISALFSFAATLVGLWILFGESVRNYVKLSKIKKLPLPCYPVVGHALSMPTDPDGLFKAMANNFLKLASEAKLGSISVGLHTDVFVLHPSAAEVILKSSKNISKSRNYSLLRPWIKEGLLLSTKNKWQRRRKMITPSFHYDILKDFLSVMNEHTSVLIAQIDKLLANKREIDIQKCLKLCALDIICETAMGCSIGAQSKEDNDYVQAVHRLGKLFNDRLFNPLMRNDFIYNLTSSGKEQQKILNILHSFTRQVIDRKLNAPKEMSQTKRKAFLDMLISAQNEDGTSLSADAIQEEVDTFMFAGHDTSSIALTWAVYLLGRNLDKQQKLQEELDLVFGGDKTCDITFDHIKDLHYLDLVIKEVLRLYPPATVVGRRLEEECVLDGHLMPKGTDVTVFIYLIHRHPEIWENPTEFIPERFETENRLKSKRSPYAYIPFSAGLRNCIGQRFAIQEQKVILAKLFRQFSVVSFDNENEIKVSAGMVLEVDQMLKLKFEKRD